jgi:hypothetical protein
VIRKERHAIFLNVTGKIIFLNLTLARSFASYEASYKDLGCDSKFVRLLVKRLDGEEFTVQYSTVQYSTVHLMEW